LDNPDITQEPVENVSKEKQGGLVPDPDDYVPGRRKISRWDTKDDSPK
jgi:hypothetical protein